MFLDARSLSGLSWQAFERVVARLLLHEGFDDIRIVGRSGDGGADIVASRAGTRWLFQVKHWRNKVGSTTVDETLGALRRYSATVPVVVSLSGFTADARAQQQILQSERIPLQLWDSAVLVKRAQKLNPESLAASQPSRFQAREYQAEAIEAVVRASENSLARKAMIVLATGLGKTFVAAESLRRLATLRPLRTLVIAHTNDLLYQLERSFWPFLTPSQPTSIWNGQERPSGFPSNGLTFASLQTLFERVRSGLELEAFDVVIVDECHHAGAEMYNTVLHATDAGQRGGPLLLGLTATPWRSDDVNLADWFGDPLIVVDLVEGLRRGFLTNIDYRIFTDNIDWKALSDLTQGELTPRAINRTLFINQWDDAVVFEMKRVWAELVDPRAIVFCGTIEHARMMTDRLNSLGFCSAAAIFSTYSGGSLEPHERARILSDFHDGKLNVVCVVDVFNEGIDVPDVNLLVFQRVTHSRRIFIQQLGRGLRLAPDKLKVIVLDFVSDIRRFAAGLELKDDLERPAAKRDAGLRVQLPHRVTFQRVGTDDPRTESFLREWLSDVAEIQSAGEDVAVLKFPPAIPRG